MSTKSKYGYIKYPFFGLYHVPEVSVEFETIQELIDYDNNLEIEYDFNFNKGMSVQDKHPNKKCEGKRVRVSSNLTLRRVTKVKVYRKKKQ